MGPMFAVRIAEFGGPEVLRPTELAVPACSSDEVLIRVAYCGVCRHDLLTRSGAFPKIALPVTLGHQVSGTVERAGADTPFARGDRVMTMIYTGCGECEECQRGNDARCLTRRPAFLGEDVDGGYAEFVLLRARAVILVPDQVALDEAAVLTCTLGTAYHALSAQGGVTAGDTVVITGASGGVGLHAIQVARHLGANVIGVVSSEQRAKLVEDAGAHSVIIAPDRRFAKALKSTVGAGADVILEVAGGDSLAESIHAVRAGGKVVIVGNVRGGMASIAPAIVILKEICLIGTKSCSSREMAAVLENVAHGVMKADVTEVVPLADAAEVHRRMESGAVTGRVVLEVRK